MSSSYPELIFDEAEDFTADRLNAAMQVLDQRLRSLEPFTPSWEAAVNDLRLVGLSRLNDAILPAYQRIQLLSEMGFLFAGSSTEITLVQDQSSTFYIDDETERSLFTPSPFLAITRTSTTADYAIAQLVSYSQATGQLMVKIKAITGNAGPHDDWQIGALAGNTLAAMAYMSQIDAARATAVSAKDSAAADAAKTAQDRIQTGTDALAAANSKAAAAQSAENAKLWDPTIYAQISYVDTKISGLVNGAGVALDTLKELADALGNDSNFSTTISASLGNRLRFDAAQTLTATQLTQARANIGLVRTTAAEILANSADNVVTNATAWDASKWIDLGYRSGSVVLDGNAGCRFFMRLAGNVTISVANVKSGQPIDIACIQDATGGRTVSWSGFAFPDGLVPSVYTGAGAWAVLYSGVWNPFLGMQGAGWKIY
jgi:hypothetical protein